MSNVTKSVLTSFPFTVQAYKQIYFLCILVGTVTLYNEANDYALYSYI